MASIFKRKSNRNRKDKPWMISYTDENGIRKTITGSTDKAVTKEIARAREAEVSRRKHGITNAADDQYNHQGSRPINNHVDEYIGHCNHVGMSECTVGMKIKHINEMINYTKANRLADVESNSVGNYLQNLKESGKSARTVNHYRSDINAFVNWCVKKGRIRNNPIASIPKLNEQEDRRRIRRALTNEELTYFLKAVSQIDKNNTDLYPPRYPIYFLAAMTGLRRKELKQLTWKDVDFDKSSITINAQISKAKREDILPLHKQVLDTLSEIKPVSLNTNSKIFQNIPTIETFYKDLTRARRSWINESANATEKLEREKSDFLRKKDSTGKVVDLHAMRTTLGTNLALEGIAPQIAQKIMRHSDYRTTLSHYTILGLADTSKAINSLPEVNIKKQQQQKLATGTEGRAAHLTARMPQNPAICRTDMQQPNKNKTIKHKGNKEQYLPGETKDSAELQSDAPTKKEKAGDGNRTHTTSLEGWGSTIELHPHFNKMQIQRIAVLRGFVKHNYHRLNRLISRSVSRFIWSFLSLSRLSACDLPVASAISILALPRLK